MTRIAIAMPTLGFEQDSGTIGGWLKQVGDPIVRGEAIAEIETEKVTVELTKRVTLIQVRWISGRAENGFASTALRFSVPFPADCETRRTVTVASSEGELPQFQKDLQTVSAADLEAMEREGLATGRLRSEPDDALAAVTTALMPDYDSLVTQLSSSRRVFIYGFAVLSPTSIVLATCHPIDDLPIRVFIRKRLQWPTVVSIAAGFLAIAGAAFGQTMRSVASEQTTRIATQSSDYQPSGGKLQTSAINLPSAGESASADKSIRPES